MLTWPAGRAGLLVRMAAALALVALLPLSLVSWQLVSLNREAMTEQVLRSHVVAARSTAERVESWLSARAALVASLAGRPELGAADGAAARRVLEESLSAWADLGILALALVDAEGSEALRVQLATAAAREAAARASGLPAHAGARALGASGDLLVVVDAPSGRGAVRLIADGRGLAELLRPEELGDSAVLVLADRGGAVLAGPVASLAEMPSTLVEMALGGAARGAQQARDASGDRQLGAWAPLAGAPWVVLSRQRAEVAEAAALRMRRRAFLAIAAALALVALAAQAAWVTIVRPLRRVLEAQRALGGVPGAGGTEIAQLEAGFAALARGVKDRDELSRVFLGRFQVVEALGVGGMGAVFRGWDPRLQRPVALKTVRLDSPGALLEREERIAALLREATTIARFTHPNVVAVYDAVASPSGAFIAMELVEGKTLELLLWEVGRLSADAVACLGLAVARALELAHEHGIVHRDVKPGNVLLGRDGAIKVVDFGVAAFVAASTGLEAGRVFGTPGFIPPEVFLGEPFDPHGDLFSLGVVLYAALSGDQPFAAARTAEVMQRTLSAPVRPLLDVVPETPPRLAALVHRLLDRDPAVRPDAAATVAELAEWVRIRDASWKLPAAPVGGPIASTAATAAHTQWLPTRGGGARTRS